MTAEAAQKYRKFVEMCDTFHVPIINFVDQPGFMIGPESERAGTIRYGMAAVAAAAQSTVPWAVIQVHKGFGVATAAHYAPGSLCAGLAFRGVRGAAPGRRRCRGFSPRDCRGADDPGREAEASSKRGCARIALAVSAGGVVCGARADRSSRNPALCSASGSTGYSRSWTPSLAPSASACDLRTFRDCITTTTTSRSNAMSHFL